MKYSIEELKQNSFITFGGKEYLPKEYADMFFGKIEEQKTEIVVTSQLENKFCVV